MTFCGRFLRGAVAVIPLAGSPCAQERARDGARGWRVPRTPDGRPDLQGFWTNMTATPPQRPLEFGDKTHFTSAEAAAYERTWLERLIQEEDEEDRTGADLNDIYLDERTVVPDLRTALVLRPPPR